MRKSTKAIKQRNLVIVDNPYQPLDLEIPEIPERRILIADPIGIGTSLIEGLNSLISRTAQKYSIPLNILMYEFFPQLKEKLVFYSEKKKAPFIKPELFKEIESAISSTMPLMRSLNNNINLQMLTTATLGFHKIRFQHLNEPIIRRSRAWCPNCYQDWHDRKYPVYDPLIWSISCIKVCPTHKAHLLLSCPYCLAEPPMIADKYRPGYCSKCRKWLGKKQDRNNYDSVDLRWHKWLFKNIGAMISEQHSKHEVKFASRKYRIMKACFDELGLPQHNVQSATIENYFPSFESFLKFIYLSGLQFSKMMCCDEELLPINISEYAKASEELKKRHEKYSNIFSRPYNLADSIDHEKTNYCFDVNIFDLILGCKKFYPTRLGTNNDIRT
ncbi:MAG: TniQ family protein [Nitrospirae bacterium]|nr:TniQ family protein [Nitrospirota bacterium]